MITIIAAIDNQGGIGRDGELLFRLSPDMRRFRRLTTGHAIIMGRKTFESFPAGPLPDRLNIVVSRNPLYRPAPGAFAASSLDEAIALAGDDDNIFIIGGGEIYRQAIEIAGRLEITRILSSSQADTFFPAIDPAMWVEADKGEVETDPKTGIEYQFITYLRK